MVRLWRTTEAQSAAYPLSQKSDFSHFFECLKPAGFPAGLLDT